MYTQFARVFVRVIVAAALVATPLGAVCLAQEAKSSSAAVELAKLMESRKLDSVAARLPAGPDEFVAALYFPGQLLVVWAKYSAPALLNEKIAKRDYRDVYIDLNSASVANSKTLITDLGADGLKPRREENQPFDAQDVAGKSFQFDGNWREDKISEEEYMKTYATADDAYARVLSVLLAELKKG
jgi:hypothetical protein